MDPAQNVSESDVSPPPGVILRILYSVCNEQVVTNIQLQGCNVEVVMGTCTRTWLLIGMKVSNLLP